MLPRYESKDKSKICELLNYYNFATQNLSEDVNRVCIILPDGETRYYKKEKGSRKWELMVADELDEEIKCEN